MFINEIDLFDGMSQRFIDEIAKIMVEESYGESFFLFKEGDPADNFYVLEEGSIRLAIGEEGHITYTLNTPGDSFGWSVYLQMVLDRSGLKLRDGFTSHILLQYFLCNPQAAVLSAA